MTAEKGIFSVSFHLVKPYHQRLIRVVVLGISLVTFYQVNGAEITIWYGAKSFTTQTDVYGHITFEESPTSGTISSCPGGDGESTYYESLVIDGVGFSIVNCNDNKPGMRRLSDVGNKGTFDFYNIGSGNLLIPGLGGPPLHGDDGVHIDLTSAGAEINAFGLNFGSVQAPTECCVVQLFSFTLASGGSMDVYFSPGDYQGLGHELSPDLFVSFKVQDDFFVGVTINQLGHNPIIDNVMWGYATPKPPTPIDITGTVTYCPNPALNPVPDVTLILTGNMGGSTVSDGDGIYTFAVASGGSYVVTPSKADWTPGTGNITTVDVIAVQKQYLTGTFLSGCKLAAADVTGDSDVTTQDVIAVQRFFNGFTNGIANVGTYQFTPASRTYTGIVSDPIGQDYDALIFGDVASPFVE